MSDMNNPTVIVRLGTQAFLILCRMFDGFYDDLKQQQEMDQVTESIAQSLLGGVSYLQEQESPPKEMKIEFTFSEVFFLKKLTNEVLTRLPKTQDQRKMHEWLNECLNAFDLAVK
ncbi:hypothetical protein ACQCN2_14735 [Brevibacillus ginsengisoli]|uniref:hypothetical protein n=1 Tax=Brevibacillus ginsengisoli TaxID=363854 RepID=UPI003CF6810B